MRAILYLNVSHRLSVHILHSQCMTWQGIHFLASVFFPVVFSIRVFYFLDSYQNTHKTPVATSQRAHIFSVIKTCCLLLFKEITAACFQKYTRHLNKTAGDFIGPWCCNTQYIYGQLLQGLTQLSRSAKRELSTHSC